MGRHREFEIDTALEAALAVFWQKGFEGTSYADLTEAMKVARPGIYAAFGNKEALFFRALDLYNSKYMAYSRDALEAPTSRGVVAGLLKGAAELQTRYPSHQGCLGLNGALACSDASEPVRQRLIRQRQAAETALAERLVRAKAEGDLPQSADPYALAKFIMTVSQGMAVQAKAGAGRQVLDAIADQALSMWPTFA